MTHRWITPPLRFVHAGVERPHAMNRRGVEPSSTFSPLFAAFCGGDALILHFLSLPSEAAGDAGVERSDSL